MNPKVTSSKSIEDKVEFTFAESPMSLRAWSRTGKMPDNFTGLQNYLYEIFFLILFSVMEFKFMKYIFYHFMRNIFIKNHHLQIILSHSHRGIGVIPIIYKK